MHLKNQTIALLSFTGVLLSLSCSPGAQPDNFTATMVIGGMEMKMAKMGDRTRVENPMMNDVVTLALGNENMSVTMSTSTKKYYQEPMQDDSPSVYDSNVNIEKTKIGMDTIDGHPCNKYEAVISSHENPDKKYEATIWEAKDMSGLIIRTDMMFSGSQEMSSQLRDVRLGAATADMFVVPDDYEQVSSMAEVMGMPNPSGIQEGMKQLKNIFEKMGDD